MIGRYIDTLTPESETKVLCERMGYAPYYVRGDGCRCLIGVIFDMERAPTWGVPRDLRTTLPTPHEYRVAARFDQLCRKVGDARAGVLIRDRILRNQLRRLTPVEALVAV